MLRARHVSSHFYDESYAYDTYFYNQVIVDIRFRPMVLPTWNATIPCTSGIRTYTYCNEAAGVSLCRHRAHYAKTSSIKPEVQTYRSAARGGPSHGHAICTKIWRSWDVRFMRCLHVDRQTDRQTCASQYSARLLGWSGGWTVEMASYDSSWTR